jgi:hypothetical protein
VKIILLDLNPIISICLHGGLLWIEWNVSLSINDTMPSVGLCVTGDGVYMCYVLSQCIKLSLRRSKRLVLRGLTLRQLCLLCLETPGEEHRGENLKTRKI